MILPQGFALTAAGAADAALLRDLMLRCWTGTVAANSSACRESVDDIARQIAGGFAVILWSGKEAVGSARMFPVPGPAGDQRTWWRSSVSAC